MARQKRTSKILENAEIRAASLKAIDAAFNLGGDLSLEAFAKKTQQMRLIIDDYNTKLSELDAIATQLTMMEKEIAVYNSRMLAGVAAKYGRDSLEYEKAGGVRTSERKRTVKKAKPNQS